MLSTCILTPSYAKDLERCRLLCESIDRYVAGYARHYVIVEDKDLALFKPLSSANRIVLPASRFLPAWLNFGLKLRVIASRERFLSRWLRRSLARRTWLSLFVLPDTGWHVQQLVKLSAAASVEEPVSVLLDSDIVFLRPWNVAAWAGERPPLYRAQGGITSDQEQHPAWLSTACAVLGIAPLPLPATDYIGPIIAWDQANVRALLNRISLNTGQTWTLALCNRLKFSEYLLYGCHVASDPAAACRHRWFDASISHTYWGNTEMTEAELRSFIAAMVPAQIAICIQSTGGTPVELIRKVTGFG